MSVFENFFFSFDFYDFANDPLLDLVLIEGDWTRDCFLVFGDSFLRGLVEGELGAYLTFSFSWSSLKTSHILSSL